MKVQILWQQQQKEIRGIEVSGVDALRGQRLSFVGDALVGARVVDAAFSHRGVVAAARSKEGGRTHNVARKLFSPRFAYSPAT